MKKFSAGLLILHSTCQGECFGEFVFEKFKFVNFFGLRAKNLRTLSGKILEIEQKIFQQDCQNCHSTCPKEHFRKKIFSYTSWFFFGHWAKSFGIWSNILRQWCENWILLVQRKILELFFFKRDTELSNVRWKKSTYWENDFPFVIFYDGK